MNKFFSAFIVASMAIIFVSSGVMIIKSSLTSGNNYQYVIEMIAYLSPNEVHATESDVNNDIEDNILESYTSTPDVILNDKQESVVERLLQYDKWRNIRISSYQPLENQSQIKAITLKIK